MKHKLLCELVEKNGITLKIFDVETSDREIQQLSMFTELPESIEQAISNKELMTQLGENILIRLAALNGIEL